MSQYNKNQTLIQTQARDSFSDSQHHVPDVFEEALNALHNTYWQKFLQPLLQSLEGQKLSAFLNKERENQEIYPHPENIFAAFKNLPKDFSVVILGQDPYHGYEIIAHKTIPQANGLAFSVPKELKIPPSLKNIEKELIQSDKIQSSPHGDLSDWVSQGVLLLNTSLTVRARQAASHTLVWQNVMNKLIEKLAQQQPLIFILWGLHAKKYQKIIEESHFAHIILTSAHPSPLSAYRGFLGCGHFTKINQILAAQNKKIINWQRS